MADRRPDLPRSRALVRLDGPGHIMPLEPVTPPDSAAWRALHRPPTLAAVAIGALVMAAASLALLGLGFRVAADVPGGRYIAPPVAAAATLALYRLFVRVVERRPDLPEFELRGGAREVGLGFAGGVALAGAAFAILALSGALAVVGLNPPQAMLLPFIGQLSTAVVLEVVVCGLGFRLVERMVGSWRALLATMVLFGTARWSDADATAPAVAAVAIEATLLFAALYMLTRRLWAAIGLGAGWKIAQVGLYGTTATAGDPHGLVVSVLSGPNWLTGGSAGPDASAPALAVNAIVLAAVVAMAASRGRTVRPFWQRERVAAAG